MPHTIDVNIGGDSSKLDKIYAEVTAPNGKISKYNLLKNPLRLTFTPNESGKHKISFFLEGKCLGQTSMIAEQTY